MNLILLFESDFIGSGQSVRLSGRRFSHVQNVHRASIGDILKVGLAGGDIGSGTVTRLDSTYLEMEIQLTQPAPPPLPLTLILALPRPKTLRKVLQCATTMGVKRFVLIRTWKVDKGYFQSPLLSEPALREQFILGLEQGCDTILPSLGIKPLFKPFVEDELPQIIAGTTALVAHPHAVSLCPRDIRRPSILAIGPEGGFIPYELEALVRIGFEAVSLGVRPLRVEDAVPALISMLY